MVVVVVVLVVVVCVCICTHMYVYECVHVYVWSISGPDFRCPLQMLRIFSFETGSLTELAPVRQGWPESPRDLPVFILAPGQGWPESSRDLPVFIPPELGLQAHAAMPSFLCGSWGSDTGPYVCKHFMEQLSSPPSHQPLLTGVVSRVSSVRTPDTESSPGPTLGP